MTARYPAYRDSGVEWLGEVPAHWDMTRLRFAATMNPSRGEAADVDREDEVSFIPMEAVGEQGELDLSRTRPVGEVDTGYTYMRDGDVTFAKITPCFENGKGAIMRGLVGGIAFGTTELTVLRPRPDLTDADFIHRFMSSPVFRSPAEGAMYGAGGQKRVSDGFVRDFAIALPPLPEQQAIAAFLDREVGKIDGLVEEQRRLIALLAEKRRAVISHAVTRGLNPAAPLKPSGVDWLGNIPAHWKLTRVGQLFRFKKELSDGTGEVLSVYREFGVIAKSSRTDNNNKTPLDLTSYQVVKRGDLVINKMKAWQGSLGVSKLDGITSPDYAVFSPQHAQIDDFFSHMLRCRNLPGKLQSISNGIRLNQWRLEPQVFAKLLVPVPPLDEQAAIVAFIDAQAARLDALSAEADRAVALLLERRAALISAAVTGKIDVRALASNTEAA